MNPHQLMRLERGTLHLYHCGPRAIAELLREVAGTIGGMPCILDRLAEYERRLSPELLRAAGGDRFAPRPLRVVPR